MADWEWLDRGTPEQINEVGLEQLLRFNTASISLHQAKMISLILKSKGTKEQLKLLFLWDKQATKFATAVIVNSLTLALTDTPKGAVSAVVAVSAANALWALGEATWTWWQRRSLRKQIEEETRYGPNTLEEVQDSYSAEDVRRLSKQADEAAEELDELQEEIDGIFEAVETSSRAFLLEDHSWLSLRGIFTKATVITPGVKAVAMLTCAVKYFQSDSADSGAGADPAVQALLQWQKKGSKKRFWLHAMQAVPVPDVLLDIVRFARTAWFSPAELKQRQQVARTKLEDARLLRIRLEKPSSPGSARYPYTETADEDVPAVAGVDPDTGAPVLAIGQPPYTLSDDFEVVFVAADGVLADLSSVWDQAWASAVSHAGVVNPFTLPNSYESARVAGALDSVIKQAYKAAGQLICGDLYWRFLDEIVARIAGHVALPGVDEGLARIHRSGIRAGFVFTEGSKVLQALAQTVQSLGEYGPEHWALPSDKQILQQPLQELHLELLEEQKNKLYCRSDRLLIVVGTASSFAAAVKLAVPDAKKVIAVVGNYVPDTSTLPPTINIRAAPTLGSLFKDVTTV